MSQTDMLLVLCEQACCDGEWLVALKLLSLLLPAGSSTPVIDTTKRFVLNILYNMQDDDSFRVIPDTEEYNLLQLILKIYQNDIDILLPLSKILFQSDLHLNALEVARDAVVIESENATAVETFENMCCHMMDRWHFLMLNDSSRNKAYKFALHEMMSHRQFETSVLDVGCGTGLLSFLASKWSNKVYAVEMSSLMCQIAENTLKSNELDKETMEKITVINKMSTDLTISKDLPTQVDILVTEIFDAGLFGEGILSTLSHAWKQLLKVDVNTNSNRKKSTVIPFGATIYIEGIESLDIRRESTMNAWNYALTTGDISIVSNVGMLQSDPYTSVHVNSLPLGYKSLTSSTKMMCVNFNDPNEIFEMIKGLTNNLVLDIAEEGLLDALCVWFRLHLTESIEVSTEVGSHGCWEQAIFPVSSERLIKTPTPISQGHSFSQSLKMCVGDKVSVVYCVKEDKLSVGVTSINHQLDDKPSGFSPADQLLAHPLAWCPKNIYCLRDWEIRALNNTLYQENIVEALKRHQQSIVGVTMSRFLHVNDGFSPLCLQALSHGFDAVQVLTLEDSHKALLWKLVQLNKLDVNRISHLDDLSELMDGLNKDNGEVLNCASSHFPTEENVGAFVVFDIVDHTGRLVENLMEKMDSIKVFSSCFKSIQIVPEVVDVWGVLIESDSLISRNRVVTNDNVLGFPVKDYVNQYSTMNHPDLCMFTLKHKKLTSPFKISTLNFMKELSESQSLQKESKKMDGTHGASCSNGMNKDKGETNSVHRTLFENKVVDTKVMTVANGRIDALIYWFDLHLSPCHQVSTVDPVHHWHQASVVFNHDRRIGQGEELHLKISLQSSTLFVSILDSK